MYGKYPYDVLTVVDPPYGGKGAGGMEYPTFITAGTSYCPGAHKLSPEGVIVHEFGHQFWYGLVGNNEFEEAWLDEGFNSYSTGKVLERAYGPNYEYEPVFGVPIPAQPWLDLPIPRYPWKGIGNIPLGQYWEWVPLEEKYGRAKIYAEDASDDAMERYAWLDLNIDSYRVQAYAKPELTLRTLEALLGDAWPKVIRTYQQRWRFKHPDAIDFMDTVREVSGQDMKWFFDQTVYGTGMLNYSVSFTTGEALAARGFFDDASGKPQLAPKENRPRPIESEVLVRRLGEMQFPVTVLVRFEDGSEAREHWDGQYRWAKFKYTGKPKIVSAQIDPDFQWKLEVHRTDDSSQAQPVRLAADKWYLRWVVWIQNVLMAFSFFS
jgi:aminopeptidase N